MSRHQIMHLLVFAGVVIALANGERSASPGCRILHFGKKLQCRGVGLSKIPVIPRGILIADFADNLITHVTQEDLKNLEKLEKVYLKGNPFHCNCKLEHLRSKLARNNSPFIQDGESIQCSTPLQIHNKALKSLTDLCDITAKNKRSQPSSGIQKRDSTANVNKCGDKCPRYSACTSANGSYVCNCKEGYHKTSQDECEDINECKTGAHTCNITSSKCQNTIGHHYCTCRKGFHNINDNCVDIDECKENSEVCGDGSHTCINTAGSYDCICEKKGFGYNHVARRCLDIDECKKSPCNKSMVCQNSQGSYRCDCKPHYRKDGNVCKDIDECADKNTHLCEGDMKCFNSPGSFECKCDHGFLPDTYKTCKDIDECIVRKHNCSKQSYCRNTPGSFKCECPKGYEGDGIKCKLTKWKRFTTPKHLLKDLKNGAWDTILVVVFGGLIVIALLILVILMLRKMCRNCCEKKEFEYQNQVFYTEEVYDPDQMFFPEGEQMFYPEEVVYYPGEEGFYHEGSDYAEEMGNPDVMYCDSDVANPIPMDTVDPAGVVPHTYYGDDQEDEFSDDNA